MKKRYVTKKLVKRMTEITNNLYKQSVTEVMTMSNLEVSNMLLQDFIYKIRSISYEWILCDNDEKEIDDLLEKKEKVDDLYLAKMITLRTDTLENILFLHEYNKPRRAPRTIEAIISELARRSLLNDKSQSDTIYSHGEHVDVGPKSRSTSKTTSRNKRKAVKNK